MDKYDIFRGIGEVEDDLLLATETKPRRTHPALRVLAASLALVLGLWGISLHFTPDTPADTLTPWFVVTAQAADSGEEVELDMNNSVLNYTSSQGDADLDIDDLVGPFISPDESKSAPAFSFYLTPTEWAKDATVANQHNYLSLSLSYDGKDVGLGDKNVGIGFSSSADGWRYWIGGRFEEPRDVTITVTVRDAKSEEIMETITVDVKYSADAEAYELSVAESKTFVDIH